MCLHLQIKLGDNLADLCLVMPVKILNTSPQSYGTVDGSRLEAVGALIHWAGRNRLYEVMIGLR